MSFKLIFVKSNASTLKFVSRTTRFWSLIFMLVCRPKTESLVKHKNIINEVFSHPLTLYFYQTSFWPKHLHTKKGSLGVPRILWVLIPSLCVTSPLTYNLWHFISFDLKTSYLWVLFVLFSFSLGNNKRAVATLVIWSLAYP